MSKLKKEFFFLLTFLPILSFGQVTINNFGPVNANQNFVVGQTMELGLNLNNGNFINVYDPSEVDIYIEFTDPNGTVIKRNSFFYKHFLRSTSAQDPDWSDLDNDYPETNYLDDNVLFPYSWLVRFVPRQSGNWQYKFIIITSGNTLESESRTINVGEGSISNEVSISNNNFYKDGNLYIPMGMNVVFNGNSGYHSSTYIKTSDAINKIATAGGNFARIWMGTRSFSIEMNERDTSNNYTGFNGIGNYGGDAQKRAFDLDQIIKESNDLGVVIQLCLSIYEDFFSPSGENFQGEHYNPYLVYNSDNNGNHGDFLTNIEATNFYKRRLRYIDARWGHMGNLIFETFNEINWLYRGGEYEDWHEELYGNYFKQVLGNNNLLTCSSGGYLANTDPQNQEHLGLLDFIDMHNYSIDINSESQLNYLAKYFYKKGMPLMIGENGISSKDCNNGRNFSFTGENAHAETSFHDPLWSTLFNGASGLASFFWTTHAMQFDLQNHFIPIRQFIDDHLNEIENYSTLYYSECNVSNSFIGDPDLSQKCHFSNREFDIEDIETGELIHVSNNELLEVYARGGSVNNQDYIIGWIHNKTNFWYNLPNWASTADCPYKIPADPDNVVDINTDNKDNYFEIPGMCNGIYKIEFYSTYKDYDSDKDGIDDAPGKAIPSLINYVHANCKLRVYPPALKELTNDEVGSPDYAFKVTKVKDGWGLNNLDDPYMIDTGSDLTSDGSDIFYVSELFIPAIDDYRKFLRHAYRNQGADWTFETINGVHSTVPYMAHQDAHVYYIETSGVMELEHVWYGTVNGQTGWHHEGIPNMPPVEGNIIIQGSDIYYPSTNGDMVHLTNNNGNWTSEILDWSIGDSNIEYVNGNGYFIQDDKIVHLTPYDGSGPQNWTRTQICDTNNVVTGNFNDSSHITVSGDGSTSFISDDNNNIYMIEDGEIIPLVGNDGSQISLGECEFTASENGSKIYYVGANYTEQLFVSSNGETSRDFIICLDNLESSMKSEKCQIAASDNRVVSINRDLHRLNIYEFDEVECAFTFGSSVAPEPNQVVSRSIAKINSENMHSIFPNPASESITIQGLESDINNSIKIYTVNGELIKNVKYRNRLDISTLDTGMYILTIQSDQNGNTETLRFIKH
jgi:hypothetical protein